MKSAMAEKKQLQTIVQLQSRPSTSTYQLSMSHLNACIIYEKGKWKFASSGAERMGQWAMAPVDGRARGRSRPGTVAPGDGCARDGCNQEQIVTG